MPFPETIDTDRLTDQLYTRVARAIDAWQRGAPQSEEPLLSHLTGQLQTTGRGCDVGVGKRITVRTQLAELHRRGAGQADHYGCDLAVTVFIPELDYLKTSLFQLKRSQSLKVKVEQRQVRDAMTDLRVAGRAFVLAVDTERPAIRFQQITTISRGTARVPGESLTLDCSGWMGLGDWTREWMSCDQGDPSRIDDPASIESLMEKFAIWRPGRQPRLTPWPRRTDDLPDADVIPAREWLTTVFAEPGNPWLRP